MYGGLVKNLKEQLREGLERLEALGKNGQKTNAILETVASLRMQIDVIQDPSLLFQMLQVLREIFHRELGDKSVGTKFKVKMPDGSIKEFSNLEEFNEEIGHVPKTSQQFPAREQGFHSQTSEQRNDPRYNQARRRRRK